MTQQASIATSEVDSAYLLNLETQLERTYNVQNQPYTDYEVDADFDFGNDRYRVWQGHRCLGCFWRSPVNGLWVAEPFYGDGRQSRLRTPTAAQQAIIKAYQ